MEIFSENLASRLVIEVLTVEARDPSLRLSVSTNDEGFSGAYNGVWISLDDYEKFSADLRLCEETRRGKATLSSMSPDEFEVTIEQCDGWGHFLLRYTLSRFSYVRQGSLNKSVSGGFDLDSGCLADIVSELARLTDTIAPP